MAKEQLEFVVKNKSIVICSKDTMEFDLEQKQPYKGASFSGPFYGVPRDNQNGVGTCYANGAKNLLVGLSQGKDVASFLDIAIRSKAKDDGSIIGSPLRKRIQ